MSFSLFKVGAFQPLDNNGNPAGNPYLILEMSKSQIANHLGRDLGISAIQSRNKSILSAMKDPGTQLTAYHTAVDGLLTKAAVVYKEVFDKLATLGISAKSAQQMAKKKAAIFFQHEKMILDIEYPIANDINTLASVSAKTNVRVRKN